MNSGQRACVFCGFDGRLDQEHVIADWVGQELAGGDVGRGRHRRTRAFGELEAKWRGRMHTSTVGTVCPDCNQHWMSDLETEVRPLLIPALHGFGVCYLAPGMTTLATWATKTALVIVSDASSMPPEPFTEFFNKPTPSTTTSVWIGAWHLGAQQHVRNRVFVNFHNDPTVTEGYSVSFTAGRAAFHVFHHWSGVPRQYGFEPPLTDALLKIWPLPSDPVSWPPRGSLTGEDLDAIGNAHGADVLT